MVGVLDFFISNIIWITLVSVLGMFLFLLMNGLRRNKHTIRVLYIQSKKSSEIKRIYTQDIKKVKINDKLFNLELAKPIIIKTFFGVSPLYIVKDNSVLGLQITKRGTLKTINNPEIVKAMIETKVISDIVNSDIKGRGFNIVSVMLGIAIGVAGVLLLNTMGVFKL